MTRSTRCTQPSAQLRLTDADGHRLTAFATNTPPGGPGRQLVSDRVGHASETVTQQIYTHRSTGLDQAAADLIAGMIREELGHEPPDRDASEAC